MKALRLLFLLPAAAVVAQNTPDRQAPEDPSSFMGIMSSQIMQTGGVNGGPGQGATMVTAHQGFGRAWALMMGSETMEPAGRGTGMVGGGGGRGGGDPIMERRLKRKARMQRDRRQTPPGIQRPRTLAKKA